MSGKFRGRTLLAVALLGCAGIGSMTTGSVAAATTSVKASVKPTARVATASATKLAPAKVASAPANDQNGYAWISYYRSIAGLAPVVRDPKLEAADAAHVRYLANSASSCESNVHDEQTRATAGCRRNPAATAVGKAAANNSDVTRVSIRVSDKQAVSNWFGAAFHALTLLDPRLHTTGYAAYYTPKPAGSKPLAWPFTAAADVYRGRSGSYSGAVIAFPANNSSTPLLSYQLGTESPEPFRDARSTACPGWAGKSMVSAPIIVQWPKASGVPRGAATIVDLTTGARQASCALTAGSYATGSLPAQFLGGANGITKAGLYYSAAPFVVGHRYQLRIAGRVITTFLATTTPTNIGVAVRVEKPRGTVTLGAPDHGLTRHLAQIWSGPNCTGVINFQGWLTASTQSVKGLKSKRLYSVRMAGFNASGGARWSGCRNFRPV